MDELHSYHSNENLLHEVDDATYDEVHNHLQALEEDVINSKSSFATRLEQIKADVTTLEINNSTFKDKIKLQYDNLLRENKVLRKKVAELTKASIEDKSRIQHLEQATKELKQQIDELKHKVHLLQNEVDHHRNIITVGEVAMGLEKSIINHCTQKTTLDLDSWNIRLHHLYGELHNDDKQRFKDIKVKISQIFRSWENFCQILIEEKEMRYPYAHLTDDDRCLLTANMLRERLTNAYKSRENKRYIVEMVTLLQEFSPESEFPLKFVRG